MMFKRPPPPAPTDTSWRAFDKPPAATPPVETPAATPVPVSDKPPLLLDKNSGFDVANLDKKAGPLDGYDSILEKSFTNMDENTAKLKKPGWWERTKTNFSKAYNMDTLKDMEDGDSDSCKIPIMETEKVENEKSGFAKAIEDANEEIVEFTSNCGYENVRRTLSEGNRGIRNILAAGNDKDKIKAALVGLNKMLPFQISEACQNVIDNFASNLSPNKKGFMSGDLDLKQYVDSDEAQCAMDVLEMLSGIKGLSDKILNFIQDIEATATIIAGLLKSLLDYDLIASIKSVLGLSKFKEVTQRALGLSSEALLEAGNVDLLEWMVDEAGLSSCISYNPDLTDKILGGYIKRGSDDDGRLVGLLDRIDPNWNKVGEDIFDLDSLNGASPDAVKAFEADPVLGPILITNVTFEENPTLSDDVVEEVVTTPTVGKTEPTYPTVPSLEEETTPLPTYTGDASKPSRLRRLLPTVGEITRIIYPKATGPGLIKGISINNPQYFYV